MGEDSKVGEVVYNLAVESIDFVESIQKTMNFEVLREVVQEEVVEP